MKIKELTITIEASLDEELMEYALRKAVANIDKVDISTVLRISAEEIMTKDPSTKYEDEMQKVIRRLINKRLNKAKIHKFIGRMGAKLSEETYDSGVDVYMPTAMMKFEALNILIKTNESDKDVPEYKKVESEEDKPKTAPFRFPTEWEKGNSSATLKRNRRIGSYKEV